MKRINVLAFAVVVAMMICSCGKSGAETVTENESEIITTTEVTESASVPEERNETENVTEVLISDEQAMDAIKNYCYTTNPNLESIAEEYPVYWEIVANDDSEVVILFRSYTGAQVRYYIDRATGNATVTEFVPGITDVEEPTGENFNVKDYLD